MKRGAVVLALLVGCATGAVVREVVVMPARAAGNTAAYGYRLISASDLEALGRQSDAQLKGDRASERALNDMGKAGWRLTHIRTGGYSETVYIFESGSGT